MKGGGAGLLRGAESFSALLSEIPAVSLLLKSPPAWQYQLAIYSHNQITLLFPGILRGTEASESYKYTALQTELAAQGETPCN